MIKVHDSRGQDAAEEVEHALPAAEGLEHLDELVRADLVVVGRRDLHPHCEADEHPRKYRVQWSRKLHHCIQGALKTIVKARTEFHYQSPQVLHQEPP